MISFVIAMTGSGCANFRQLRIFLGGGIRASLLEFDLSDCSGSDMARRILEAAKRRSGRETDGCGEAASKPSWQPLEN